MSKPPKKIDNVTALKLREDKEGKVPQRWAGIILENNGPDYRIDEKGVKIYSGLWNVVIQPKDLEETVEAEVNEDREVNEEVQFSLDPSVESGRTSGCTWFKRQRNQSDRSKDVKGLPWEDTPGWREDMTINEGV